MRECKSTEVRNSREQHISAKLTFDNQLQISDSKDASNVRSRIGQFHWLMTEYKSIEGMKRKMHFRQVSRAENLPRTPQWKDARIDGNMTRKSSQLMKEYKRIELKTAAETRNDLRQEWTIDG
jgi:hypothetical protein